MNILLVDDESSAIQALQKEVNWDSLEFEHIFTALSVAKAKEIIENEEIHILLCDIEMPGESGLDLLDWIGANCYSIKCVFLTCYSDFSYVKKALSLGSVDYCLKPICGEEIEAALKRAIDKHRDSVNLITQSRAWQNSKTILYRHFWTDLMSGFIPPEPEAIRATLKEQNLTLDMDAWYLPIYITAKNWKKSSAPEKRSPVFWQYDQFLRERAAEASYVSFIIKQSDHTFVVILEVKANALHLVSTDAQEMCRRFLKDCSCVREAENYCYIGNACKITELPEQIEQIHTMDHQNVIMDTQIQFLRFYESIANPKPNSLSEQWGELMNQMNFQAVRTAVIGYLDAPKNRKQMSQTFLQQFFLEYYQALFLFANQRHVLLSDIMEQEHFLNLASDVTGSLKNMKSWVVDTLQSMEDYFERNAAMATPAEKVKAYIVEHIREEIPVTSIAEHVHMNNCYLTRIFKKETGKSIVQYILEKKMEIAKMELVTSDKTIGEIAMDLGYLNYGSFSRAFTKHVGVSPKEYKKSTGGTPDEKENP